MNSKAILLATLFSSSFLFGAEISNPVIRYGSNPSQKQIDSITKFGSTPTIQSVIKETKRHLADILKDPESYREGDWTIWMSTDKDGNPHVKALHEFSSLNGFGGRVQGMILVSSPTPLVNEWHFTNLNGNRVGSIDLGAMILDNMKKELSTIPEKDITKIKAKRTLGGEEIN